MSPGTCISWILLCNNEGVRKNTWKSGGYNIKISARDHLSQLLWLMAD